jgi:hypothetical protein
MSWFLLLVILLVGVAGYSMAQEIPPVPPEPHSFRQTSSLPKNGGSLARSAVESQVELSGTRPISRALPETVMRILPATMGDASQESSRPVNSSDFRLLDESNNFLAPVTKPAQAVSESFFASDEHKLDFPGLYGDQPAQNTISSLSATGDNFQQLLVNPGLDFADSTVERWLIYDPEVYVADDFFVSPPNSLALVDADSGDATPNQDAFFQIFWVPASVTKATIKFSTASLNSNKGDLAFINLWSVANGNLDQPLASWAVGESEGQWQGQMAEITDQSLLQQVRGKLIAIFFYNDTIGAVPNESVFFDDITFTVEPKCNQLLVNTQLDILEFGDGTGTAEPWSIIFPIVEYISEPDGAYDGYSLVLPDGDSSDPADPSPTIGMFAQGFIMPSDLTEINIEYQSKTTGSNPDDNVYGELWLLDDDWVLHLDEWDTYFVADWTVAESEGVWAKQTITSTDQDHLNKMAGQKMAILLYTDTDGGGATEVEKEWVLFDNIELMAWSAAGGKVFLPTLMRKSGVAPSPICVPPNENPLDQFHSNRGLVQTNATCSSTLSNVDKADYYTFKPEKDGQHTLHLTNLPIGTEWSAMIFTDTSSPDYAPGGASDGKCRITMPGAGDKQVTCGLNKGSDYFVKVSAGSTVVAGSYTMRITAP